MSVQIDPIINALLQLVSALILGVGTWAISKFVQWLNLKNSAMITASLDDALQKSVTFGLQQSQDLIRQHGWDSVEVKNKALAAASVYAIARFPDTLKAVGLDMSNTTAVQTAVEGALDRAFPHAAAVAAASPATPPPTAPNPSAMPDLANYANVTTNLIKGAEA